jgi:aspartyl-tRNA(Asn)/glutamyl-tRNA(Gln) amidotransferase subunit C
MPSPLSRAEVQRIAALARLDLTDAEIDLLASQLAGILQYAADIQSIDTAGIPPTSHPLTAADHWREDTPEPCLARDEALGGAPDVERSAGLFRVPKVL